MKRIIFLSIASLLCAVSAMAADKLVVSDITVPQGKEAVLDIGCELQTACKAFQMDVELGSGFTLKLDATGKPVAELGTATDHKIYSRRVSNGKYRFVVISMNGKQLPKSGSLLKLTLVAPSTAQAGSSATCSVKAIEFATAQTKPLILSNATFKVIIATPPPKGDTNGDNVIDVADIATIISVMAGGAGIANPLQQMADVNEDGIVDVADIATVISIMAGSGSERNPDPEPSYSSCPDDNHPHSIDLGLPSGTKWACCNVGATKPEEYGGYYAWGESEEKETYSWDTYLYGNSEDDVTDIDSNIANTKYDVAHVKWGDSWCMPTEEQRRELRDNCTLEKIDNEGIKYIAQNGNIIFFPFAGYYPGSIINGTIYPKVGEIGCYWLSTQDDYYDWLSHAAYPQSYAIAFDIEKPWFVTVEMYRFNGCPIRPVK